MTKLFTTTTRIAFAFIGLSIILGTVVSTFNYERSAQAAYNAEINYQGKLTNGSNVAVADGTYNMEFKLYDAVSSGTLLWTETRTGGSKVQVTNGVFSVMLGEVNAFGSLDFNQTLFLSVNIGGTGSPSWDGEMTPRKKIGTVPVAFLASNLKGTGLVDITNTATQATFNYDGSNRATLGVASNGFTTLTSVGSGAGWNLTGGNVGIGTATTSAKLHVTATTEQLRVGYDAGNYSSFTTSSGGDLTIAPSGSDLAITGNVDVSGTLTAGTANAFNVNASGVVTAGTWQGTVVGSTYGGTGVNNGSNTITLGGNVNTAAAFTTAGANALTLTTTGTTNVTLPTTGTLITSGVTTLSSLVSIGTITTGVWNGTIVTGTYGGTGISTASSTGVPSISSGTWSVNAQLPVSLGGTGTNNGSITGTGALSFTAGSTAQNVNLVASTTGSVLHSSTTANTDTINIKPQTTGTGATFAGIITTADLTASDKTYTFPNANITVNAAADISGSTLASGVTASSLTSVGTLSSLALSGAITGATGFNGLVVTANTGVVTTGTWNGTDIAVLDGGTGSSTSQGAINNLSQLTTNGDLLYHNGTNSTRLARGADTECLKSNATTILWGACSAGGGYATIQDEAGSLTQRTTLNFTGAGVSCVDNGGATRTDCTISGGGSTTFDTIGDAAGNGAVSMGTTVQTLDWGAITTTDALTVTNSGTGLTSGSAFKVTSATTGAVTNGIVQLQASANYSGAGGLLNVTANSTTAGTVAKISGTGLTTGTGLNVVGGTAMTTGTVLSANATYVHTTAETGNGTIVAVTDASTNTTGTSVTNGLDIDTTVNTSGAGLKQINALNISAPTITACTTGACTFKGLNVTGGTGSVANVTSYGAYIDAGTGSGTEYAAAFLNGNVGIGTAAPLNMLEVGSAAARGDIEVYGDIFAAGYDIQRSLTGIVDIFVYDTSKDSDGGEWRNTLLSQQLSWATETKDHDGPSCVIGTDDRCGNDVFPRKAIIVSTTSALYIFDGSNNTLWMTFTQAGTYALGAATNNNPSGVGAQNGVVVVGTNGSSATGMYAFDFKQDTMFRYNATNRVQADKNIGNRNTAVTYATDANTSFAIVDAKVNDVSIAMQTSSTEGMANTLTLPLDSAASPVRGATLIAAATDTGVSVVNMATRSVLSYSDATNDDYNQVVLTSRGRLYATNETRGQLETWRNVDRNVISELNGTPDRFYDETTPNGAAGKTPITTGTVPVITTSPGSLAVIERASSARESAATTLLESGDIVFVGTDQGLAEVHTSGGNLVGASWSKITTTTVATPYMVGAPRGVFLFDDAAGATSTASAVGTTGTTRQVLDQAGATAPTFGGSGVRGTSVNFGNNSYLCSDANSDGTCDADTDFNTGTISFTVSLWFKHSTTAASDTLFERCYTPATPAVAVGCIWAGMTASGTIKIGLDSITTWTTETTYDDAVTSTATYNDNQWHHLVYTNTDTDICLYIDGKQANTCDVALAATATLDASQVLTVGGSCSGANCTTGTAFWDGSIDDMVWSSNGATTDNGLAAQSATKIYLDGRAHLIRPTASVTDATTFSTTTIGDSGESYVPGSFAGLVVELTGGTGSGQTRTIVSNDATTFTVYPAFTVTPGATTDYQVKPSKLYGSSNNVVAIAPDLPTNLNRTRKVYVGTSDGSGGGGISVFTNAGTGSIKTEVIHSDAGYPTGDLGGTWSGTGADNITAIATYSDTVAFGNGAFFRAKRADVSLKQLQLDTSQSIEDIRQELVSKQLFGSTQDVLGLGQGADLAEYYYSTQTLDYGDVVVIDKNGDGDDILRSTGKYSGGIVGIVATRPGIILGSMAENGYPVALTGRVPVKFSYENGAVKAGDYLTTSSIPGHAMRATGAGSIIGKALADSPSESEAGVCEIKEGEELSETKCSSVMVFVEHGDFSGLPVEQLMDEMNLALSNANLAELPNTDSVLFENGEYDSKTTKQDKILAFLTQMKEQKEDVGVSSQILTDRLSATFEVISPSIVADGLEVLTIGSEGKNTNMLSDLTFIGRPYFNSDTAGFAKIVQDDRYVDIVFDRPYLEQPTVVVNITQEQDDQLLEEINQQVIDASNAIDDARVELLFGSDVQYLVTRKSANSFRIILNKPAPQDITFSWIALAVKKPRLVVSENLPEDSLLEYIDNSLGETYDDVDEGSVAGAETDSSSETESSEDSTDTAPENSPVDSIENNEESNSSSTDSVVNDSPSNNENPASDVLGIE